MKKDFIRDYATAAFRLWALRGCPTYEQAAERIKNSAYKKINTTEPKEIIRFIQAELDKRGAELCDIMACEDTFRALEESGKSYICEAVKAVYMENPQHELKSDEITKRVLWVAQNMPASERQVYRWIAEARNLFALSRGLRVEDSDAW